MTLTEEPKQAYIHSLCIDFYSCTITDPDGNEWYWSGQDNDIRNELHTFIDLMREVVEFRENLENDS